MEKILQWDKELFLWLNGFGSEPFDAFWLFITKQINWLPFFILIAYLVFKHLGWKHALMILGFMALLLTLTDQTTNLIKDHIQRIRPGNNPEFAHLMRIVQKRNSYSFFSGHAANSMAAALFLFRVLRPYLKYMGFIFLWPLIFAYSRIYLGLHYPLDICCGYLWGAMMSTIVFYVYDWARRKYLKYNGPKLEEVLDDAAHR
jgi:undecaprenyl-diphosphatase